MARRKIAMRLIENARSRATTYAKRCQGLRKKAWELSKLCDVPVALVCAPAAGAPPLVWESKEGTIDRYRATAVTPETRARHTHRSYLEAELGKEKAKLARAKPAALPDWDPALDDMTLDEAREVLETIDAALRAAGDKMAALGLNADGQMELEQVALAPDDGSADSASGVLAPQLLGLGDTGTGFEPQLMPCNGGNNNQLLLLEQFLMEPDYGLECGGGSYDVGVFDETQALGGNGGNADCAWPDLTMCYTADESWDAVTPTGYYPDYSDTAVAPEHSSAQNFAGGNYVNTVPLEYPMGMLENFAYPGMDNSYMPHWQAEGFQHSDTSTGHYQYQWSDPGTCSSNQAFHYQYQY